MAVLVCLIIIDETAYIPKVHIGYQNYALKRTAISRPYFLFLGIDEHIIDAADSLGEVVLAYTDDNVKFA